MNSGIMTDRRILLDKLRNEPEVSVVIIGGGIVGAGLFRGPSRACVNQMVGVLDVGQVRHDPLGVAHDPPRRCISLGVGWQRRDPRERCGLITGGPAGSREPCHGVAQTGGIQEPGQNGAYIDFAPRTGNLQ